MNNLSAAFILAAHRQPYLYPGIDVLSRPCRYLLRTYGTRRMRFITINIASIQDRNDLVFARNLELLFSIASLMSLYEVAACSRQPLVSTVVAGSSDQ
jgi:hypothetical protein